jgi:hypothetical protein
MGFGTLPRRNQGLDQSAVFGGPVELHSPGLFIDEFMIYRAPTTVVDASNRWWCLYAGEAAGAFAFYPGCPGTGDDQAVFATPPQGEPSEVSVGTQEPAVFKGWDLLEATGGTWSTGGTIGSAGDVRSVAWATFLVEYSGAPTSRRNTPPRRSPSGPARLLLSARSR